MTPLARTRLLQLASNTVMSELWAAWLYSALDPSMGLQRRRFMVGVGSCATQGTQLTPDGVSCDTVATSPPNHRSLDMPQHETTAVLGRTAGHPRDPDCARMSRLVWCSVGQALQYRRRYCCLSSSTARSGTRLLVYSAKLFRSMNLINDMGCSNACKAFVCRASVCFACWSLSLRGRRRPLS